MDNLNLSFTNLTLNVKNYDPDIYSRTDAQCMFLMYAKVNFTLEVKNGFFMYNYNFLILKRCSVLFTIEGEYDCSIYSVFIYVNANNTNYAFSTNVYFFSVFFSFTTGPQVSFMALYGLISNTYIYNLSFYASDLNNFFFLFYIWSGRIEIKNTYLEFIFFVIYIFIIF